MQVLTVRDRASSGGGIYNYYQAVTRHLKVRHRFVDVGRPYSYYGANNRAWIARVPTLVRLLYDWVNLCLRMIGRPGLVHLNPCLDPVELRSLRRDAVNLCLAKLFRRRVLVFWRGWDNLACGSLEFPGGNGAWMSRVYRWADAHIVLASDFRDDLRRWGFKSPIYLETTVVADSLLDGVGGDPPEGKAGVIRLLFLSRVEIAKGVFELLDAFALLESRHPRRYHLTIAGDGPDLEELMSRASDLGLDSISFPGYVTGQGKLGCFKNASIFCFLSYTEGMPNAVLEAMAMGLPLVSSDAGGLKDILTEGVTGCIIKQNRSADLRARFSPEEVAERIDRLVASKKTLCRISNHNRKYARERFSAVKVASRLDAIYRDILESHGLRCRTKMASRNESSIISTEQD